MHERKDFWDKNAGRYDRFMRNDPVAYEKMYGLIRPVVKAKPYWKLPPARGLSQRASWMRRRTSRLRTLLQR